jgi:DNA-binding FadR family transcriptional regulator
MEQTPSDDDLARALKPARGAPPRAQVRVVREILRAWEGKDRGVMPNLAEIGRCLGVQRQVVSEAIRALRRKGVLTVIDGQEAVVTHRKVRRAAICLPQIDQLTLPFGAAASRGVSQARAEGAP